MNYAKQTLFLIMALFLSVESFASSTDIRIKNIQFNDIYEKDNPVISTETYFDFKDSHLKENNRLREDLFFDENGGLNLNPPIEQFLRGDRQGNGGNPAIPMYITLRKAIIKEAQSRESDFPKLRSLFLNLPEINNSDLKCKMDLDLGFVHNKVTLDCDLFNSMNDKEKLHLVFENILQEANVEEQDLEEETNVIVSIILGDYQIDNNDEVNHDNLFYLSSSYRSLLGNSEKQQEHRVRYILVNIMNFIKSNSEVTVHIGEDKAEQLHSLILNLDIKCTRSDLVVQNKDVIAINYPDSEDPVLIVNCRKFSHLSTASQIILMFHELLPLIEISDKTYNESTKLWHLFLKSQFEIIRF